MRFSIIRMTLYILSSIVLLVMFPLMTFGQIVKDGLVAYWPLDPGTIKGTTVEDVIGDNEGVLKGNPKAVAGKIGGALEFDGTNSVDIEGTKALNFNGKDTLTVAAWINAKNDSPVQGVVAGCCGTIVAQRDANGWALRYDGRNGGQEFEFIVCPGWQGDGGFGAPKNQVKPGEWHYLAGVVDKKMMRLYLDGELVKESAFSGPISSLGPETEIGHANDGGFIGIIDEVVIYDRALTGDEIKKNFQAKSGLAVEFRNKLAVRWGQLKTRRTMTD